MPRNDLVEANGLSMRFGGVTALETVDFRLSAGELRCLIGPNGAGKSTFFKCLTGMLNPTEGHILIDGEETTGVHPFQIARLGVGIKTQVPSLMNDLSARENIWLAARRGTNRQTANATTDAVIERLDLGELSHQRIQTLSHGKRQLVELGIVLAGRPRLILLDEPAAGLSAEEIDLMVGIIHQMNREAALVIVEHDMHFVRAIADRVTVFHQGRVLIEDHVDTVMADKRVRDVYLGKSQ